MTIKDKINEMIEQYSITHDNPTVLRELIKLAALTQVVIDWVNNNDPTDFTEQIKQINDRMDEIEELVRALNLEEISAELEALRTSVADAVSKAAQALTEAGQASSKADHALTKAVQVETSLDAYKTSNDQALEDLEATLTEAVSNADTKAEAAMTLADGADTNASNALTKAGNALTKAEQAVLASGTAMNAAGEATAKAEAVEQALSGKQDVLTFDQAPTADSQNPVTSGGVYKAIRNAGIELDDNVTQTSQNGVKSSGIYKFVMENQGGGGTITLDDTVTAESQNGVKSSGIHAAIEAVRASLSAMITAANAVIESHTDDIAALQEFQTTQDTTNETHNTQIAANKKAVDDLTVTVTENEESVNTRITQMEVRLDRDEVLINRKQDQLYSRIGSTKYYVNEALNTDLNAQPEDHNTIPTSLAVYNALTNKQDTLTLDQTPTADSQNPVTSGGVYAALQGAGGGGLNIKAGKLAFNYNERTHCFEYHGDKNVLAVVIKMRNSPYPFACQVLAINGLKQGFIPVSVYNTNTNIPEGIGTIKDMCITPGTLDIPEAFEVLFKRETPDTFYAVVETGDMFFCIYTD